MSRMNMGFVMFWASAGAMFLFWISLGFNIIFPLWVLVIAVLGMILSVPLMFLESWLIIPNQEEKRFRKKIERDEKGKKSKSTNERRE